MARGDDGLCRLVWSDTRTGNSEVFFTLLDAWGNRLLPDVQVSHSPAASSTVPRVDVDAQGYAYICWLENKTVWLAKLDIAGNAVDSTAVDMGFNYLAEFPDLDVTPSSGLGVGFTSQSGVSDEDYQVLFDPDLNKICQRMMGTNLTWLDRHVTERCDDDLSCTMYWQSVGVGSGSLAGGAMTPTCGNSGSGGICSGTDFGTMSNHAAGLVVQRGNRIYLGSGGGCLTAFSELPGPSVAPAARTLDTLRSCIAWQDGRNGSSDIYFAVYDNANRVKAGVDSLIAGGPSSSSVPSVTTDLKGVAMMAWQDDRDGNNEIYFARTPEPSASFGTLTGTVYDAVTLQPIPYAHVLIQGPQRPLLAAREIVAGSNGQYRVAGLLPGLQSLVASSVGHVSPRKDGVAILAGQSLVVDFYVSTGAALTGTVRDLDSQRPVRGATITLQSTAGAPFLRAVTSGLDGAYRFDVSPAGTFALRVSYPVPGVKQDYFSVANPYYLADSVLALAVPGDLTHDVNLACNTIVLLHGIRETAETCFGKAANVTTPADSLLRARLENALFHTEAPTRDWHRSIPEQGLSVARWFADRPFTSARVIAHSMGGLAARWYIEKIGAPGPGRSMPLLVTLGTPNHGTPVASEVHTLLLALGALPEALGAVPLAGGLSMLAWEVLIRDKWPFLIDLVPNSRNLDELNYGSTAYSDNPFPACDLSGGPAHAAEQISNKTTYIALAGENGASKYWYLVPIFGKACASDGAVPVHSARLWNAAAINRRTRCLSNSGTGGDCDVAHVLSPKGPSIEEATASSDLVYVSSKCLAVQLVNMLHGSVPAENCASSLVATSGTDSLYSALPESDQVLAARDSMASTFSMAAGESFNVWVRWQRGGIRLRLTDPLGVAVDSAACVGSPTRNFVSDPAYHWAMLAVTAPGAGAWAVHVSTVADSAQHVNIRGFVAGAVTMEATSQSTLLAPGQSLQVTGTLKRAGAALTGATVAGRWSGPGGGAGTFALHDDGLLPDATAGDGVYAGEIVPPRAGAYSVELTAIGGTGLAYGARAARSAFRVGVAPDIRLSTSDISASQKWAYPGDPLLLQVQVHNVGGAAADSVWFGVRDDSTSVMVKDTLLAVPGGSVATVPVTFSSTRRGLHQLSVWAVASGDPSDSDPTNNSSLVKLEIVEFGQQTRLGVAQDPGPSRIGPTLISRVVPSPSHDVARIEYLLPESVAGARLAIYDVAGRVLGRLDSGPMHAGWQSFTWDTRLVGPRVKASVCFYRLECAGRVGTGTIVMR